MRSSALLWICACTAVGLSSSARSGAVYDPTYANLYWETSPNHSGANAASTGSWDKDIAVNAQGFAPTPTLAGHMASMTRDSIDSYMESLLWDPIYNNVGGPNDWGSMLQGYGVYFNFPPFAIESFEIIPDQHLDLCPGVTPPGNLLQDWINNLSSFVACAVALQPSLAGVVQNPSNVVLNIFLPPWLSSEANIPGICISNCAGPLCGPLQAGLPAPAVAYNWGYGGHQTTIEPTQLGCAGDGIVGLIRDLTHEIAETTTDNQIADACETSNGGPPFSLQISAGPTRQSTCPLCSRPKSLPAAPARTSCFRQNSISRTVETTRRGTCRGIPFPSSSRPTRPPQPSTGPSTLPSMFRSGPSRSQPGVNTFLLSTRWRQT